MDKDLTPWYSPEWFFPSTLRSFTWENSWMLWFLLAVPVVFLVRWFIRQNTNQKLSVAITRQDLHASPLALLRLIPDVLMFLTLALLITGLARPQKSNEKVEQWTEGIDIMIALDISQSMLIEDFVPNRLEAAKEVAKNFIDGRVQDRIGLVVFAGDAFSMAPLTTDYDLLRAYLKDITYEMIESKGTAIGSAMAVVTNRMGESDAKSKVCILLSDGDNTAGNIDPITAAELATAYGIKIYTIVVGKEGMVPYGKDFFGRPNMVENTIDESTMRKMASIGGGEFFRATDNRALEQVFARINQYEKAEIKETRFKDTSDYYYIYVSWAVAFFLLWLLLKSTFISNILQD
ncbi:vWA domain-containing protein [Parachryseolinea silvisoli]|jgi:Ca-activated chloride channel family protein|uniref:vWA domain-containing protein n=1 Tax=Parachryseolinea silvisoli TaxID=2873601 RepID=UPI0022659DC4|nr:VWA domain-containing protein [Parachryseolinea silvisoli]MCD9019044.1 VWA domain-containing protein [Parachryseolinea silvisoli]